MLYFLHSTSVLSFYIDVVLTLSISLSYPIILKFCTEYASDTQNGWTTERGVMDERDFSKIELN